MFSHLLKRALPFTLTLILGATLAGFFNLFGSRGGGGEKVYTFKRHKRSHGEGRGCDYRRNLLAESKDLVIRFKPDAVWPRGLEAGKEGVREARVLVTFGADGKVRDVEPAGNWPLAGRAPEEAAVWVAVERAARNIEFTPETLNGRPVSVTKEVKIRFIVD